MLQAYFLVGSGRLLLEEPFWKKSTRVGGPNRLKKGQPSSREKKAPKIVMKLCLVEKIAYSLGMTQISARMLSTSSHLTSAKYSTRTSSQLIQVPTAT